MGYKIKYIKIDSKGFIDLEDLKKLITDQTLLVSIIWANNEIGVIQDINGITKITRKKCCTAYGCCANDWSLPHRFIKIRH